MSNRVVITGIGPVTPIGVGREDFENNVFTGKHGNFKRYQLRDGNSTELGFIDADRQIKSLRKEVLEIKKHASNERKMPKILADDQRIYKLALLSSILAKKDAGLLELTDDVGNDTNLFFAGVTPPEDTAAGHQKYYANDETVKRSAETEIHGQRATAISRLLNIRGIVRESAMACSSTLDTIITGFKEIKHGESKLAFCGGVDSLIGEMVVEVFRLMRTLAQHAPDKTITNLCRPFCTDKTGTVLSEGGGMMVLEELERAKDRGAETRILAEVLAGSQTADAFNGLKPSSEGLERAILKTLKEAKLKPEDISFIQVHGTGTEENDKCEFDVLTKVFGEHLADIFITANKSRLGHMIGGAGFQNAAELALSLKRGEVPITANMQNPDPRFIPKMKFATETGTKHNAKYGMAISIGFGGLNTCLILKKYQG